MYFYATNPPIHQVCVIIAIIVAVIIITLWLLSLWFRHSRHIVVVSLSLSYIVAVLSPSLHHHCVVGVFITPKFP